MSPRSRPASRPRVDLSVTSASRQASQANWDSCSQHKVSPSAGMDNWTPPGPPLRTTAVRSPRTCGPRPGTGRHSEPSTAAKPSQHCASPSKPTGSSSSPGPTSTQLPEPQANVAAAGRRAGNVTTSRSSVPRPPAMPSEPPTCSASTSLASGATLSPSGSSPRRDSWGGWTTTSKTSQPSSQIATQPDGQALHDHSDRRHGRDRNRADRGQKRRRVIGKTPGEQMTATPTPADQRSATRIVFPSPAGSSSR